MAYSDSLASSSGNGFCGRGLYLACTDASGKSTANLLGNIKLSTSERASSLNESPNSVIIGSLSFK
jgi:hypothetical protein